MSKYKMKKGTLTYNGTMYCSGDVIEMDVFDNSLPRNWFEELKSETKKLKKTKEVIEDDNNKIKSD